MYLIAHDLKTPLTGIKSSVALIEAHLENKSPSAPIYAHLNKIDHCINTLNEMINGRLNAIQSDTYSIKLQSIHIENLIYHIATNIMDKDVISFTATQEVPKTYNTDKNLFTRIFINLMSNAFKYAPNAKHIEVNTEIHEGYLRISVVDYGIGIPKKDQSNLFKMFYRSSNTSGIEGTGLGLVIVKESVKALNGKIHFTSIAQKGSTFVVDLPL